jgi:hypothetical protein
LCGKHAGVTIGHFKMLFYMRRLALVSRTAVFAGVCAAVLLVPFAAFGVPQVDSQYGPLPVFELHSGFWVNLHHVLYQQARARRNGRGAAATSVSPQGNSPSEQAAWNAAVAYYEENYATGDLAFSGELILLKNQLGDFEICEELSGKKQNCDAGLSPRLTQVLDAAAPVYRAHDWPEHDRANRKWIAETAPLVRQHGLILSERLAEIYQAHWPKEKIRVDVTSYAGSAGAYTTLDPLRVIISSLDARNQGRAALEVLFHEASQDIAEPVELAINRECRQRDKPTPRDLWHALVLYTISEVIIPAYNRQGESAQMETDIAAAARSRLSKRGWDAYGDLLATFWQPYMDGNATFDDAIARMISSL